MNQHTFGRCDLCEVRPDTSSAFSLLANFCQAKNLANECILALAIVLMSTSDFTGNVQLPSRTESIQTFADRRERYLSGRDKCYDKLFASLDKYLTLSCIEDGIDSLLCSVFFDPVVPCNLVGAQSLAIKQALGPGPFEKDPQRLVRAIAARNPRLSLLWLAVIWNGNGEISEVVDCALNPLATTNLPAACWTGTIQSFLQVKYYGMTDRPDLIPRTWEFITAYFARDVLKPFTRAPPFGLTKISNLNLEVRQHLDHNHRPLQWRRYWVMKSDEKLLIDSGFDSSSNLEIHLLQPANVEQVDSK